MAQRKSKALPTAGDVGYRVSIRIHDNEPGKYRDLLGHLVDPTHIQDKHGVRKAFDPQKIVAWRILER